MSHPVKKGDRYPGLLVQLRNISSGAPLDLTNASSVVFRMRTAAAAPGVYKASGTCTITSATTGQVTYAWGPTDTDTLGDYEAEFVVTWSGGLVQTIPTKGYLMITVEPTLA